MTRVRADRRRGTICGSVGRDDSEGAQAMGLARRTGSLEPGKAADVLVLDKNRPEFFAASEADPHDLIAFGGSRAAVKHLFVNGDHLVDGGALSHLDINEIRIQATRCLDELLQRARL